MSQDYCFNKEEDKVKSIRYGLNTRYPYFKQNIFTAGDFEQFLEHWKVLERTPRNKNEAPNTNASFPVQNGEFEKYHDLCIHDYYQTFLYIHEKFKKGCFIQFHDKKLKTFLPFSKQKYKNEWYKHLEIDPKFGTIYEMMKYLDQFSSSFPYDESRIQRDISCWYGNNGLVRFEFPLAENENGYNILRDMFETLSKERDVPDIDFFLNKRDFPILSKDDMEPYESFYGTEQPLLSHCYSKMAPILSMNTTDKHADIPIPTWEDWRRCEYLHNGKLFRKDYLTYDKMEDFDAIAWESRKNIVVWRGASTGRGTTVENNIRLFVSKWSSKCEKDVDGELFIDAGINKFNLRPRKHPDSPYLSTIIMEDLQLKEVNYMTPLEQAQYKYILDLPGHTCAYRLSWQMFSGSVILLYPCDNKLWFFHQLEPWVHYVPIEKEFSVEEIKSKIRWCKENDGQCKEIAENARKFANQYLSRDGILNYLQKVMWTLYERNNLQYTGNSLHEKQILSIMEYLNSYKKRKECILPFFEELYTVMDMFENDYAFSLFLQYLDSKNELNNFLTTSLKKKCMVNSKKTVIHMFQKNHRGWIQKDVFPCWKRDDLHQVFLGYYCINPLADVYPHFIHTYYHQQNEEKTSIYLEYIDSPTLDKQIASRNISLDELFHIWYMLSFALQTAQRFCGFCHMDLYPWNIIVRQSKQKVTYYDFGVEVNTDIIPVMIDYGNSHVFYENEHYYTTTPFHLNSFLDIFCMVISSLEIYLTKITLNREEIGKLIRFFQFFQNFFPKEDFSKISYIRNFLKEQKKFSNMLSIPNETFKNECPIDFASFLYENNFVNHDNVRFYNGKKKHYQILHQPVFFRDYFQLLQLYRKNCSLLSNDDVPILVRRLWLFFQNNFSFMNGLDVTKAIHVEHFIMEYKKFIEFIETTKGIHIWKNFNFTSIETDFYETNMVPRKRSFKLGKMIQHCYNKVIQANPKQNPPLLKSHLCSRFDVNKKETVDLTPYRDFLYLTNTDLDFFLYRKSTC